jgi:hypothetical protein
MSKVIRLTESDIMKLVSGVIEEKKTQELKSTNTLMVEINSMLNFHYKSNSAFLKYTEDFSERFNILQDVKNLVENLFSNDNIILERFNKFSNKGVIVESTFNFQEELNGYFKFTKASLLYQGGFITESQYNNYDLLVEDWWDDVKSGASSVGNAVVSGVKTAGNAVVSGVKTAGNAVASGVKTVGKAVVSGAKTVGKAVVSGAKTVGNAVVTGVKAGYAALQGAWNKLKSLGVSAFMDKFRGFLTSNYGAALQILIEVSTEGFGAAIPLIAWALLAEYDMANVIAGTPNWFNLLFSLIGTATTGIASKAIGAAMPFFKSAGKAAGSITQAIEYLAKSKFGQMFKPLVSAISAGLGKVPGLIAKAMTWVKAVFGKVFGESVVNFFARGANAIGKFIGELGTGIKNFFSTTVVKGGKKVVAKGVNTVLAKAGSLVPKIDIYLATASGKRFASKVGIEAVNIIKKELTSTIKTYSEDQALAYIDKKYGKVWGDTMRFVKTVKDVKGTAQKLGKNAKNLTQFGIQGNVNLAASNYKDVVSNTEKLIKNTAKAGELGNKVATEV